MPYMPIGKGVVGGRSGGGGKGRVILHRPRKAATAGGGEITRAPPARAKPQLDHRHGCYDGRGREAHDGEHHPSVLKARHSGHRNPFRGHRPFCCGRRRTSERRRRRNASGRGVGQRRPVRCCDGPSPLRHGCDDEEAAGAAHDGELQKRHRGQAQRATVFAVDQCPRSSPGRRRGSRRRRELIRDVRARVGLCLIVMGAMTREQAEEGTRW